MKTIYNWLYNKADRVFKRKHALILGIVATTSFNIWAVPEISAFYTEISNRVNPAIVASNEVPTFSIATSSPDRLEQYYQEELKASEDKYQKIHQNAARQSAIERVQSELEKEKEQLRESELLL